MPIGEWITAFFRTPGMGGIVIILVIGFAASIYFFLTRWILRGGREDAERTHFS